MAPELRNSEKWGNIFITPDLTRTEREAAKKVRDELAVRRKAGEANLMIRKGKIVVKRDSTDATVIQAPQTRSTPSAARIVSEPGGAGGVAPDGVRHSATSQIRDGGLSDQTQVGAAAVARGDLSPQA